MNEIEHAAKLLQKGDVVIFPTESSYGMAARLTDKKAISKIFALKGRPQNKSLPIIAANLNQMRKFAQITKNVEKLSRAFHPGPLTLIVKAKPNTPNQRADGTIAFRISSHKVAHKLCELVGEPITATSANKAGEPAIYDSAIIRREFPKTFIIDRGILSTNKASTIFHVEKRELIRAGPIAETDILKALE